MPGTSVTYKLSASAVNHLENAEVKFPDSWKDTEQVKYSYPKTDFKEGESIGLYVVNSNNTIEEENVKLTRDQDGKWMPENDNTKFLKLKNYKYFAYYPYSAAAPNVDATKENADEFFKDMITNWNPVNEQKTEKVLLSQDLQVGKGEIGGDGSTLTFNMAHSMGLAVLNLKSKEVTATRTFTTNNYTYYFPNFKDRVTTKPAKTEYSDASEKKTIGVSTNFTGNNIPCLALSTEKRYVQIVKPGTSVAFKATETSITNRDGWGILEEDKNTFNVGKNSVSAKDITADAEFYNFSRYYTLKKDVETFTAPEEGSYKLECWGANGGSVTGKGGGYTYGTLKNVAKGKQLFVCVGGQGQAYGKGGARPAGGYNGGGTGGSAAYGHLTNGAGGGGATHIALQTGLLTQFVDTYSTQLLMVAGGAAGVSWGFNDSRAAFGGGEEGGWAYNPQNGRCDGVAGQNPSRNMFGKGQDGRNGVRSTNAGSEGNSGGGGGFCGGYSSSATGWHTNATGGGGSGYVNTTLLEGAKTIPGNTTFLSPTGNDELGHQGDGAAVITWFAKDPSTTK